MQTASGALPSGTVLLKGDRHESWLSRFAAIEHISPETVLAYNRAARSWRDDEFGKPARWVHPLKGPSSTPPASSRSSMRPRAELPSQTASRFSTLAAPHPGTLRRRRLRRKPGAWQPRRLDHGQFARLVRLFRPQDRDRGREARAREKPLIRSDALFLRTCEEFGKEALFGI